MQKILALDVVTPNRRVLAREVDSVVLPGEDGFFGVRPGHRPLMAAIRPGWMLIDRGGSRERFAVGGGFAEVLPNRVNVLVSSCEREADIDLERATRARDRAAKRLRERGSHIDRERAARAFNRALARIRLAGRKRSE